MNFQFIRTADDDTDIFQIESSGFIKNLEQKARFFEGAEQFAIVRAEICSYSVRLQTDSGNTLFGYYDA